MSLFEFLFPDVAQSQELRRIADSASLTAHQSRLAQARVNTQKLSSERRIEELENEVAQLTIVLEAIIEQFCDKDRISREELAAKIAEIDLRDGVADGRITKTKPEVKSKSRAKLIIPE